MDNHDRLAAFLDRQRTVPKADQIPVLGINPRYSDRQVAPPPPSHERERAMNSARWLRRYQPDVVLGINNMFRWTIKDAGWRIPKQVAFISLWVDTSDRLMTGLVLTTDEVGSRAIDWLDSFMRSGERGIPKHPAVMLVNMLWQPGKTAPGVRKV